METTTETKVTTQVYRVYIKAPAQAIWDAITKPDGPNATAMAGVGNTTCVRAVRSGR